MFPSLREDASGEDFIINIEESVLTSWSEVFKAVYGKGVMSRGFSLHFVNGGLKFHDGEWFICFI